MTYNKLHFFSNIYPTNDIVKEALSSFTKQLFFISESGIYDKIISKNNEVFKLLSELPLRKFFVSITSSDSIYYRFSFLNSEYEFKLEVFFDYEEEDEFDIESTLHIYNGKVKEAASFGSLESLHNIITNHIHAQAKYSEPSYCEIYRMLPQAYNVYQYGGELSPAVNPSKGLSGVLGY